MQTWRVKKKTKTSTKKPWTRKVLGILLILLTIGSFVYDFPTYWNQAVTQVHLPGMKIPEAKYRLGLDLQGGTHLVYDADMSQIPDAQRADALEGVKNVIE